MSRRILEKTERRLGAKLFLKAERCLSAKCAEVKKPYAPGQHGKGRRRQGEYGKQMAEKQKVRFTYGLTEAEMKKAFSKSEQSKEPTDVALVKILESRLDNVVFQLGLAPSRRMASQLVGHGHITVNGRKTTIPSMRVRPGDKIAFRKESADHPVAKAAETRLKQYEPPTWLKLDKEKMIGEMVSEPKDIDLPFDLELVVNFYSK
ncbi:MAG TPA: 30S ribosomal protein S4 [Candidatus Colwellbacteria bacterium]|nr:30S ribosomal protein S4 [Candidatus Colwellbacteria bacterium]HQA95795.1 30S ribosomal protein S4 [Candidatus Colwellbacteria bacterium]